MLSGAEIARGTQGALGFLQRDSAAVQRFDNTAEACLRSFRVMLLVAPVYALYLMMFYGSVEVRAGAEEIVLVEVLRYAVDWLLYPVIFYEIARRGGWLDRYPRYISALNWINLPAVVVLVIGMAIAEVAPAPVPAVIELGLRALFFYWFLMATRLALGVSWMLAALLLAINWVPSLLLSLLVTRILGLTPIPGT